MAAGQKTKSGPAGVPSGPKKHHCPVCPADDKGRLAPMVPTMIMPGRKMKYFCQNGHEAKRGGTILA